MPFINPYTGTMDIQGVRVDVTVRRSPRTFGGVFEASARLAEKQGPALPEKVQALQWHWDTKAHTRHGAEVALYALVVLELLEEGIHADLDEERFLYFVPPAQQEDDGTLRIVSIPSGGDFFDQLKAHLPAFGAQNNVIRLTAYQECDGVNFDATAHLSYDEKEVYATSAAYIVHVINAVQRDGTTAVMFTTR